ncbi:MAG: hypothetical protein NVSMB65_17850 [Chloroflexota bacterium]
MVRTTSNLGQIRYVTEHYRQLQGLRLVPFGAALLLAAPLYGGWHATQSGVLLALWLLPLAVGIGLSTLVSAYYARTFGRVQHVRRRLWTRRQEAALWVVLLGAIVATRPAGSPRLLLAAFTVVVIGGLFFTLRRSGGVRPRRHWAVLAGLLALVNLPLLVLLPHAPWIDYTLLGIWTGSLSVCLIVGGLLDHRLLMRTLTATSRGGEGQAL